MHFESLWLVWTQASLHHANHTNLRLYVGNAAGSRAKKGNRSNYMMNQRNLREETKSVLLLYHAYKHTGENKTFDDCLFYIFLTVSIIFIGWFIYTVIYLQATRMEIYN